MSRDNSRDVSSLEVTLRGSQVEIDPIANGTKPFDDVKVMLVKGIDGTGAECLATEFSSSTSYSKGSFCTYNGSLYRANTSHQGVWNASDFDEVTVDSAFMAKGRDYVTAGQKSGTTLGTKATAEGVQTTASGDGSHAEGAATIASGQASHAEGSQTQASGLYAHAEGNFAKATHTRSHAEGYETQTGNNNQHVQGKYNVGKSTTAFEIGNGSSNGNRSNAFEVDWSGNVVASGDITDGDGNVLAEKADISDISEEKTVNGNPITLPDALPLPVKCLVANVEPIQDLHGYDKPWVGGANRNLFECLKTSASTTNGITCTPQYDDGDNLIGYKLSGTASADADFILHQGYGNTNVYIPSGTYNLKMFGAVSGVEFHYGYGTHSYSQTQGDTKKTTTCGDGIAWALIRVKSGTAITTPIVVKPMIWDSSIGDSDFYSYSNICPISGWTEVSLDIEGKNKCPIEKFANSGISFSLKAGSYTFSFRRLGSPQYSTSKIKLQDSDNNNIASVPFTGSHTGDYLSAAFTLTETTSCHIANENVNVDSSGYAIDNIQIERGNERTDFVPYITPITKTKSLGGTYYGFSLDWLTGVMTVNKGITVFDGSEDEAWVKSSLGNAYYLTSDVNNFPYKFASNTKAISSLFKFNGMRQNNYMDYLNDGEFLLWYNSTTPTATTREICAEYLNISTLEDWRSYLASNNLVVCYDLQTPLTVQLTPTEVELLRGYNYISSTAYELILAYLANRVDEIDNKVNQTEIATVESGNKASRAYAVNEFMMWKGGLYKVTQAIASGATITSGTNVTKTTIGAVLTALLNG